MVTRTWSSSFVISKFLDSMQYYMMLLEQWGHIDAEVVVFGTWLDEDQIDVGLITWLTYSFCRYVKLFLPSIVYSVDFWSSKSCIVLEIVLADKNVIKELGVFLMGRFRDTHFVLLRKTNPQGKQFCVQKICT